MLLVPVDHLLVLIKQNKLMQHELKLDNRKTYHRRNSFSKTHTVFSVILQSRF